MERRTCNRCGHSWFKRIEEEPKRCAKCRSQYWDKPRVRKTKKVDK